MVLHCGSYSVNIFLFLILNRAKFECSVFLFLSSLNTWNAWAVPHFLEQLHLFQTFIWHVINTESRGTEVLLSDPCSLQRFTLRSQVHSYPHLAIAHFWQADWILITAPKVLVNVALSEDLISKLSTLSFQPLIKQQPLNHSPGWSLKTMSILDTEPLMETLYIAF